MTNYVTYKDIGMKIREGEYKEWYDTGKLWKSGKYKNDNASGEWKYYDFKTNHLMKYGNYKEGFGDGIWTWVDIVGNKTKECMYLEGKLNGLTIIYNSEGDTIAIKNYLNDELVEENILDTMAYLRHLNEPDEMPILEMCSDLPKEEKIKCRDTKWLEAIYNNIYYPELARKEGIEGQAHFMFYIDKEGYIQDLVTMRGLCNEIEEVCVNVIKKTPRWVPGLKNGKPVKVVFKQPINFRLE